MTRSPGMTTVWLTMMGCDALPTKYKPGWPALVWTPNTISLVPTQRLLVVTSPSAVESYSLKLIRFGMVTRGTPEWTISMGSLPAVPPKGGPPVIWSMATPFSVIWPLAMMTPFTVGSERKSKSQLARFPPLPVIDEPHHQPQLFRKYS